LFQAAQREYLKGNWFQTEKLLERFPGAPDSDFAVELLRISLLRRLGRTAEARAHLAGIGNHPAAAAWRLEVEREGRHLERNSRDDGNEQGGWETLAEKRDPGTSTVASEAA
ncbi:MAG TPA: hypothetical protein VIY86_02360, partial [Pirellulaceae bacterium]